MHRLDVLVQDLLLLDGQLAADGVVVERARPPRGGHVEAGEVPAAGASVADGIGQDARRIGRSWGSILRASPSRGNGTTLRARSIATRLPTQNPLPEGTLPVGSGLVVLGLTAYAFFVVAARALGPEKYSSLSVLWTLVFFAAPGFFFPLEQEVGRAVSARRAVGEGGGPVIRRAILAGAAIAVVLALVVLAALRPVRDELFDGSTLLLLSLLLALPAYAATHLTRGVLSGNDRFPSYGILLAGEGLLRVLAAVVLAIAGVTAVGAYGLLVALAPIAAIAFVLLRERSLADPGPEAPWTEISGAIGWLLAGAVLAQGFVNASVPVVKLLAADSEAAIAGQFQAGLIVSRVPLFLFQAVQAALLPKLAGLAAAGRLADFRTGLRRLVVAVVLIAVVATAGAFAVGPMVLRLLFGPQFDLLGHRDLGLLAAASGIYMLALALSQALIALSGHARAAFGWLVSVVVLTAVIAAGSDLLLRVELGLLAGAVVGAIVMAVLLRSTMARGVPETAEPLLEAISPEHEIVEP